MKIIVLDGYTINSGDLSWAPLETLGDVTVYERTAPEETAERIGDAAFVLTNKVQITKEIMDRCEHLRYIGVMATGFNVVDLDAARTRGITVTNVPAYSSDSVSQLVFALLLHIANGVADYDRAVKAGDWVTSKDFTFFVTPQIELANLTLGIYGYGAIGARVAVIASALGMKVIAHRRSVQSGEDKGVLHVDFDTLLKESDVLTLHAPLTAENTELFDKEVFAKMKPGAILINTARGGLVNENDLADALNTGHLYAAGVDVVSVEPMQADNPLLTAKNIVITPHIAYATKASRKRLIDTLVRNIENYLNDDPTNVVS
jgi:glycerate dehydrogenase